MDTAVAQQFITYYNHHEEHEYNEEEKQLYLQVLHALHGKNHFVYQSPAKQAIV